MQLWVALRALVALVWACLAYMVLPPIVAVAEGGGDPSLWRHISLEQSRLSEYVTQTQRNLTTISCGAACMTQDWCGMWCHEKPHDCLLTSLIVSASYTPSQPDGALSCYTSRLPDLATGAAITTSISVSNTPVEIIIDGAFGGDYAESVQLTHDSSSTYAWLLVDLGITNPISEVLLISPPYSVYGVLLSNIEVRVGNVQRSGDFTTYQLLGTYTDTAEPEEAVVIRSAAPITGRYVSVQRMTHDDLELAHLEIR